MKEITLDAAVALIQSGRASFDGTVHTEHFGYAAIITRYDLATTDNVSDVGPEDIAALEAANKGAKE